MTDSEGLTIVRGFDAPREIVFEAWTDPALFAKWWGGTTVTVPEESVTMDVRPGGSWTATMILDSGHEIHWLGEYVEVDPPERLVLTLSDGPEDREVVTVVLREVSDGTEMVCHQGGGHLTAKQYDEAREGYLTFFDAMAELVEA